MRNKNLSNIFLIPHLDNQFIVYLPLFGILFKGNAAAINHFHKALQGDKPAQEDFGLSSELVNRINQPEGIFTQGGKFKNKFNPTSVSLFLTTDCSMKCIYCYANAGEKKVKINKEFVEVAINEIIKNAISLRKNFITVNYHGGGDIGVAWDLVEQITEYIIRKVKENNISVRINAGLNGILSDYQRAWIVKNIYSATISLDGYEEIQNRHRPLKNGMPSFDIVDETIKYFDKHNFNYGIRSTVTAESLGKLEEIITFFCTNYRVRKIKIEPVFIQGRAALSKVNTPLASEFVKRFIKAQKTACKYKKELLYSGSRFEVLTNTFCQASGLSFAVTPEGYITSCYEVLEKSNPASDIFFYGKIEKGKIFIYQNKFDSLTSLTVEDKEKCRNCFVKFHCAGDCPLKDILTEKGDTHYTYRCTINRELTKTQLIKSI
jgi:uncharacterized protein